MSVVTNHQLFSHTYLARLQADSSHDEAAAPIAQGLRDWMPFRDASSLPSLIDSWVGPVLDFLEFLGAELLKICHFAYPFLFLIDLIILSFSKKRHCSRLLYHCR